MTETVITVESSTSQRLNGAGDSTMPVVTFYNLSDLLGQPVRYDDEARPFGRLYDIGGSTQTAYPLAISLDITHRGEHTLVSWSAVKTMTLKETVLSRPSEPTPTADFWARRDVLDDQVVDVSGAQVLRVNDVHLIYSENKLIFGHVEVGLRGILRRLRFERPIAFLANWLFDYSLKDSFVTWRHIQVLSPGGVPGGVRVSKASERLADIHPAELADILEQLGVKDRQVLFNSLSVETAADTLEEINPEFQRTLVSHGDPGRAADILEEMAPNEAAEVLRDLGPDAQGLINQMEHEAAAEMKTLLAHKEESVGSVMDPNCIEAKLGDTASSILEKLRDLSDDVKVYNLAYIVDDKRVLKGVISLREIVRAAPETTLQSIMNDVLVHVTPETRIKDVARDFAKFGFQAIPIVDAGGVFQGIVRYDSVLSQLADYVKD
ncbi:MAG: CBS domain-containing protein [bacterium]